MQNTVCSPAFFVFESMLNFLNIEGIECSRSKAADDTKLTGVSIYLRVEDPTGGCGQARLLS